MSKAILLLSGGLDSILAGRLLLEQGIEVEAVNFTSPFCTCTPKGFGCSAAKQAADRMGVPVKVFACGQDYLDVMKRPRFGRGRGMNACLDCRIFIFSRAAAYQRERGADFIATGEVLGERPMSQRRRAMELIESEAGLDGLILRPLCARSLPPSLPEQRGLVDRSRLQAIQGRSRKPQLELAARLGVADYPCPAGGCLLTDRDFAAKFSELLVHDPGFGLEDAKLLKHGRHFRLPDGSKAVLGREEAENGRLIGLKRAGDVILEPEDLPGPTGLVRGSGGEDGLMLAAGLIAAYTKGTAGGLRVRVDGNGGPERRLTAGPLPPSAVRSLRIGSQEPEPAGLSRV